MNKNIVTPLAWDTEFFNINCGRLVIDNQNIDMKILSESLENYDFVSIQNVNNDIGVNKKIAEYTNAFLVDVNVQFEKKLAVVEEKYRDDEFVFFNAADVTDELFSQMIVEESDFAYSKFVCDPGLKKKKGFLVYKEWLNNARKENNKFFILLVDEGKVGAYILFSINDKVGTIELVKVNNEFKGKHIATHMVKKIEEYMSNNGVDYLRVGTQLNNIPAMNLYHSLFFKEISRTSVFHYWGTEAKED